MNSVRLDNLSLKYQRFTLLGCRYIRISKFDFVAKTQFLLHGEGKEKTFRGKERMKWWKRICKINI